MTDPLPFPADAALSQRLRLATHDWHHRVERSDLMTALVSGRIESGVYCALLRNLQAVYAALEAGLDACAGPAKLTHLWASALRRCPALEADLVHLHGRQWRDDLRLVPAAQAYAQRLMDLAATEPVRLVAHAYLRYLGDLHGGQLLGTRVRARFGLSDGEGTHFYAFGDASTAARLRLDFRTALDALALTPVDRDAVVAEALAAYVRHQQLFDEVFALASPATDG